MGTYGGGLAVCRSRPDVDFNGDGLVGTQDLLRLIESWGQDDPMVDIAPPFGDGVINALDLELLKSYWEQELNDTTLVAHWALDETEGMVVTDSAGGNDGYALGDPIWQPEGGQVNGALQLDGVDDYVVTATAPNPADGSFSVFAWINGGAPGQVFVSQQGTANWLMVDAEGALMTELKCDGRSGSPLLSQIIITDGQWHRVGFVWDGFYRSLYADDILAAEDTQQGLNSSDGA